MMQNLSFNSAELVSRRWQSTMASDFDCKFDEREDVTADLDPSKSRRLGQEQRCVNVD